jgi:DHA2 family multidrug resistance protein
MLQGVGGAALVPLSQAILFEINEPKDYGRAMSLWGMAATAPPAIGPTLGGWLTDNYSWRWVFYINLPIGLLAFVGLLLALPRDKSATARRFDLTGFVALSVAIASFQLMLDRGQLLDWFSSREIVAEAVIAGTAFYIFLMHILSSAHPFVSPAIFKDRNYVGAVVFLFLFGVVLFATLALLPPLLQTRLNYPVITAGLVLAPRGLGMILGMFVVGRLVPRYDARVVMGVGMALSVYALWQMTQYSLQMDSWPVMIAGLIQGLGVGAVNVCLSVLGFVTLDPKYRNEATSLSNLIRSTGGAIGISVMVFLITQNTQRLHAAMGEHVTAYNMHGNMAAMSDHVGTRSLQSLMMLDRFIVNQGQMIAYIDDFRLMMILTLFTFPFILIFRRSKP